MKSDPYSGKFVFYPLLKKQVYYTKVQVLDIIFTCFLSIKVYLCSVRMIFNLIPIFAYVYTNCVKEI